jgi:hypothetical protein
VLWLIVGGALAGLAATTLVAVPAAWLGFAPPPLPWAGLAALLPLAVVGVAIAGRRLRSSFARS